MSLQPISQIFRNELCLCMYLCQVKVRFFAQPCTIVKQSCGPKDDLLFTQLFSLSKNCMHYEVQGCAEILPMQILYLMTHSYMSTSNWPSPNVLPHCNSFKHKWNFELEKAEFYGIFLTLSVLKQTLVVIAGGTTLACMTKFTYTNELAWKAQRHLTMQKI